jgi:hypothetical protein
MAAISSLMVYFYCIINRLNKILMETRNNQNITGQFLFFTQKMPESLNLGDNNFLGLDIKNPLCLNFKV